MKLLLSLSILLILSCSPSPEPIEYGSDLCNFCQMTIVDRQHGAELVSDKGRIFKFDAIECMVNYLHDNDGNYAFMLVNDFDSPGELINAETGHYLVSKAVPSPMGAFLSGFSSHSNTVKLKEEKGGEIYNWSEIQIKLTSDQNSMSTN